MTAFTDEVRSTVSPHKFGGDRMAAACYLIDLDGCADEVTGDVEAVDGYVARIGRRLLTIDSAGFVSCSSFADRSDAGATFRGIDEAYCRTLTEEEAERDLLADGFRPSESVTIDRLYPGEAVKVLEYPGVAFRVDGLPVRHGPDYDWSGIVWQHPSQRETHMVGDDRTFTFDVDDLSPLDDDDYCSECGQIGCRWGH